MRHADRASVVLLLLMVVLGLAATATFAGGRAYRSLSHPSMDRPERPAFVTAPDPILRATKGLDPNATDIAPGNPRPGLRTIQVFEHSINLLEGGQITRYIPVPDATSTPQEIADAIDDPTWMRASAPDEVQISAALIMQRGTTLTVAAPLRRIVLETQSGVFLGGDEATLSFTGVDVEASDRAVPADGEVGMGNRPFVVAQGGTMNVTSSTFRYLGRDWNDSYGVSWTKGATGFAVGSTFEDNFTGIFVATAIEVSFDRNTLRGNTLNGLTAYEVSAGLTVERNLIEGNGRGGIVLSSHVTGSKLRNNTVQNNGFDGIMAIGSSDDNDISANLAQGNGGDGIVVSSSSGNAIDRNSVRDNRVAISVYGDGSTNNAATNNMIDDNGLAVQGLDADGNFVLSNGNYWRPAVLIGIWVGAVVAFVGLLSFTRRSQRKRILSISRPYEARHRVTTGAVR